MGGDRVKGGEERGFEGERREGKSNAPPYCFLYSELVLKLTMQVPGTKKTMSNQYMYTYAHMYTGKNTSTHTIVCVSKT